MFAFKTTLLGLLTGFALTVAVTSPSQAIDRLNYSKMPVTQAAKMPVPNVAPKKYWSLGRVGQCKVCDGWAKGAPGTFAGACIRWKMMPCGKPPVIN